MKQKNSSLLIPNKIEITIADFQGFFFRQMFIHTRQLLSRRSARAFHDSLPTSLGLKKFKETLHSKTQEFALIHPSSLRDEHLSWLLSVSNTVLGWKGETVFPEVLTEQPTCFWSPEESDLERIRLLCEQENAKEGTKQSIIAKYLDTKRYAYRVKTDPSVALGVGELTRGQFVSELIHFLRSSLGASSTKSIVLSGQQSLGHLARVSTSAKF